MGHDPFLVHHGSLDVVMAHVQGRSRLIEDDFNREEAAALAIEVLDFLVAGAWREAVGMSVGRGAAAELARAAFGVDREILPVPGRR